MLKGALSFKVIFFYVLFGFFGGLLGGMGMGGGTILIPLLSVLGENSKVSGAINLVSFVPMAIFSLILHVKNGLVEKEGLAKMIIAALFCSLIGFFIGKTLPKRVVGKIFGAVLLFMGIKGVCNAFFKKK